MSKHGDDKFRSMYLGMINVSFGIGLAGGSLLGAYLYKHFGEKAGFALKYAIENYPTLSENLTQFDSMNFLIKQTGMTNSQISNILFNHYNPQLFWIPFIIIGIVSIILLIIYNKKFN